MNDYPGAPEQFDINLREKTIKENEELLAKINSDSILKAPLVRGSVYFYINTYNEDNQSNEELIDDPTALDTAIKDLGIEIRHENKHHRWVAQAPQALKVLEIAKIYLKQKNKALSDDFGINAELKWRDSKEAESIIHLMRNKDDNDWNVKRYT